MLRRLFSRQRAPISRPRASAPSGPLATVTCLDLRRPSALRYGILQDALLFSEADALTLRARLPPCRVLHDTPAQARDLADRLGLPVGPATLAAWVAGGAVLRLPDCLDASGEAGWVQDIRWAGHEFRFTVLLLRDDALVRLDDLPEEALTARSGRGAAGLGEQIGGGDP
jgi:hypothetical protein